MNLPAFGQREQFIKAVKVAADAQKALVAIRQLNLGVVKRCDVCHLFPYESSSESWPCSHRALYDSSLRSFTLEALNAAAAIWSKEAKTDE